MIITEIQGDLLETGCKVIAHQVNSQGVMGSGVALAIKKKYPKAFSDYLRALEILNNDILCGSIFTEMDDGKWVASLCSQFYYRGQLSVDEMLMKGPTAWHLPQCQGVYDSIGNPVLTRFTNYEALYRSLETLKSQMHQVSLDSVAFPYKMGADRGGGDWNVILEMIKSVFRDVPFYIEIRKL